MGSDYSIISIPFEPFNKKEHIQRWASNYFVEHLTAKGFISYKGESLSWYKVVNKEVLLTVYLHSFSPVIPIVPAIGYGIHPLFIEAPIPQKVTVRGWIDNEVMSRIYFASPKAQFDKKTYVLCPDTKQHGAEELSEHLWPIFDQISTIHDAYSFHKTRYLQIAAQMRMHNEGKLNNVITTNDFVDMAIFLNDEDMYPICLNDLDLKKGWKKTEEARMSAQYAAIVHGKRDKYLDVLNARKEKFVRKLNRKVGITL